MDVNEVSAQTELLFDEKVMNTRFDQAINALKEQFSAFRIGRANPGNISTEPIASGKEMKKSL